MLVEVAHHAFELALPHLPVRDFDARLGHEFGQARAPIADRLDFVVQKIDLAAALQFTQERFAHQTR